MRATGRRLRGTSLRDRLVLSAAALIALTLVLTGLGLRVVMDSVLDARALVELDRLAKDLAGLAEVGPGGEVTLRRVPADPRSISPYGGLYWQVAPDDGALLRSRSLWDTELRLPAGTVSSPGTEGRIAALEGPHGSRLIVLARRIRLVQGGRDRTVTIAAGLDRGELADSRRSFLRVLVPALFGLGAVLILAMTVFVRQALLPFRAIRQELQALREGRRRLLAGDWPEEVQPLADDLNRLVAMQDEAVLRARAQAGDLAHGLKTPLAILAALARRLEEAGNGIAAREIEDQAAVMGRQVDRALARGRGGVAGSLRREHCAAAPVTRRLLGVMARLPDWGRLEWQVEIPADLRLPVSDDDLTEMLGNLMDNARKWGCRCVTIRTERGCGRVGVVVEDDGPGMEETEIAGIDRGRRWDEATPGSGFGLAITLDLVRARNGTLALGVSRAGGLRAALTWPAGP